MKIIFISLFLTSICFADKLFNTIVSAMKIGKNPICTCMVTSDKHKNLACIVSTDVGTITFKTVDLLKVDKNNRPLLVDAPFEIKCVYK